MGNRNLYIGNLKVRLPRNAAGSAQQFARELGRAILRSSVEVTRGRQCRVRMEELDLGNIKWAGGVDAQGLQKHICGRVAAELEKRLI